MKNRLLPILGIILLLGSPALAIPEFTVKLCWTERLGINEEQFANLPPFTHYKLEICQHLGLEPFFTEDEIPYGHNHVAVNLPVGEYYARIIGREFIQASQGGWEDVAVGAWCQIRSTRRAAALDGQRQKVSYSLFPTNAITSPGNIITYDEQELPTSHIVWVERQEITDWVPDGKGGLIYYTAARAWMWINLPHKAHWIAGEPGWNFQRTTHPKKIWYYYDAT